MSKVVIAGDASGTGTFTISAPNGNTDRTLVLPDEAGTVLTSAGVPASAMPAGSVIQVVQVVNSTNVSTSSTTPVASGLSASITPQSSTNKILVLITACGTGTNATACGVEYSLYKDGTSLFVFDRIASYSGSGSAYGTVTTAYLDAPSTTSTLNYQMYYRKYSGTGNAYLNNYVSGDSSQSTITLMEIAG